MSEPITIPLWAFAILLAIAAVVTIRKVLFPMLGLVARRSVKRAMRDIVTELEIPPRPFEEVEAELAELYAHIHAATYRLLVLIAEIDRCGEWGDLGLSSTAHWLNWRCGIGFNAAREKVMGEVASDTAAMMRKKARAKAAAISPPAALAP